MLGSAARGAVLCSVLGASLSGHTHTPAQVSHTPARFTSNAQHRNPAAWAVEPSGSTL